MALNFVVYGMFRVWMLFCVSEVLAVYLVGNESLG